MLVEGVQIVEQAVAEITFVVFAVPRALGGFVNRRTLPSDKLVGDQAVLVQMPDMLVQLISVEMCCLGTGSRL